MGSLSDVLKKRRKELGLTLAQIADKMGVAEATVQRWESGNIKSVRHDKIAKLAEILQVSPASIMGWETDDPSRPLPPNVQPVPKFVRKPRLGTIACGSPILAVEEAEEFDEVPADIPCDFTLKCKGDSMVNARIYDGDTVYIRQQEEVENGEIAAVRIGEEATLKRVYYNGKRIILRACNPLYNDLEYEGETLNEIEILGKAIAFTSVIQHHK